MRVLRIATVLVLVFAFSPVWAAEDDASTQRRPVKGMITHLHPSLGILRVGPMEFRVPAGVYDLDELEEGIKATVFYQRSGDELVAVKIIPDRRPD